MFEQEKQKEINRHISDYNILFSYYECLKKENSDLINENKKLRKDLERNKQYIEKLRLSLFSEEK